MHIKVKGRRRKKEREKNGKERQTKRERGGRERERDIFTDAK